MNEQTIRKNNMKLFPIYKMFSWDLLFYYAISFLFLTQAKNFSASEIMFADSFYPLFGIIFQFLCVDITDRFGKQKSLLLGNICVSVSILMLILGNSISAIILSNLLQAIGFGFKGLCEPTLLSDSIPDSKYSSNIFSRLEGKGSTLYYILDAISSAVTGFMFVINAYIPMIMCFIFCIISTVISLSFEEISSNKSLKEKNENSNMTSHFKDILITFKQILKSDRLKCLLIYGAMFYSILGIFGTLRSSILVDIGVKEQYFGPIVAAMQIISAISSRKQNWFHTTFKNRLLTWLALSLTISFILTGLIVVCDINFTVSLTIILIMLFIVGIIKGPYYTLIKRYFNSFSNPTVNTKIYSIHSILNALMRTILSFFTSFLLGITTTSYTFVILGCILFIFFIFLLDYMKTRIGLKPEEYPEEDLIFTK